MIRCLTMLALWGVVACTGDANGAPRQFDAAASMQYIQTQLDFGPRIPGSEGHRRTGAWLVEQMRVRADTDVAENMTFSMTAARSSNFDNLYDRRFTQMVITATLHLTFFAGDLR